MSAPLPAVIHRYAQSLRGVVGLQPATTPGVFDTTAYPQQRVKVLGLTPNTPISQNTEEAGLGAASSADVDLRSFTAATPFSLCFNDVRALIAAGMREDFAAGEVAVQGDNDIEVLTAGTHQDGETQGPQLRAPAGAFADIIGFNGGAENAADGMIADISGASAADNNFPRGGTAWTDGTNDFFDIRHGFVAGASGFFGAPMVATVAPESVAIRLGVGVRNRFISAHQYWNGVLHASDTGMYQAMVGLTAGGLNFSWSGKGPIEGDVPWEGVHLPALQATDPTEGGGFDKSGLLYTPRVKGTKHLKYLAIVTEDDCILLTNLNVTGGQMQLNGNVSGMDDIAGSEERTGTLEGAQVAQGSLNLKLVDDPRAIKLAELGAAGTAKQGTVLWMFEDGKGNRMWLQSLWNTFSQVAYNPTAGGGTYDGTLNLFAQEYPYNGTWTYQELAA